MSTEFYVKGKSCPVCQGREKRLYIGTRSHGWAFSLHMTETLNCLAAWEKLLRHPDVEIRDEYGDLVSADAMLADIQAEGYHRKKSKNAWDEMTDEF